MTPRFRALLTAVLVVLYSVLFVAGCGETFRPIATTVTSGGGDPQQKRHAVVVSNGGPTVDGAVTHVNISGDTNVGQVPVGQDPVHAAFIGAGVNTYVANRASGSGKPSLTVYTTFTQPTSPTLPLTSSLPDNSAPTYLFTSNTSVYVALSGLNTVGVLVPGQNTLISQIPVGSTPVAIAGLPDLSKFYVANQGSNDVTVFKADNTVSTPSVAGIGTAPSYIVASADSTRIYVVNRGSGNVSVINTSTDAVISTVTVGASPNFAVFDARNMRVYVTNSGGNTISVINADTASPNYLAVTNVTVGTAPVSLAVLQDGSRVYVANSGSNSVSVLSGLSNAVLNTLSLGGLSPVSVAASNDNTKVEVAAQDNASLSATHADGSAIVSIRVADNALTNIPAPFANPACTNPAPASLCARLKPTFVLITP
jgi:YVTN family beta-propeller protein